MYIPKIVFKPMSLEKNIDRIKWAFYEDNESLDVHKYTIEYFPELANLDTSMPQEYVYKQIENLVGKIPSHYYILIKFSSFEILDVIFRSYSNLK